jgi:hypothetical protein
MNQLDEQHKIDDMRRRLYSRGQEFEASERHGVSDVTVDVSRNWEYPAEEEISPTPPPKKSRRYRLYILFGSFFILLVTALGTGTYMFYGGNEVSSNNIDLVINGPSTLGGGERLSAQIAVTNQNSVAIESATLIISYPTGSQTVNEPVENLFERRVVIDQLDPGESRNVLVEAMVFGEEGDEKRLSAQLEYSIANSDNFFYKDAEPQNFRITSSPVVLQVRSIRRVASGQEVEVEIVATSNTGQSYENLLVTASYPSGFTYQESSPEPVFNQNVWRIERLDPEEEEQITIRGSVAGLADETLRLNVSLGPSMPDNQFMAGAILTDSYTEFVIERPFIDVVITVNDETSSPVILEAGSTADVEVSVTNTLSEPVYDMVVEIVPRGSIINTATVSSVNGFYNSNTGVVRFEAANEPGLREVRAGDSERLSMQIDPNTTLSTASFTLDVNVYGKRLGERDAQEQLFGTTELEARYASVIDASNDITHVSGPVPPVVGQETIYQVTLTAAAGSNEITNGVVTTLLPVYVDWLANFQADGPVTYNPVSRELEWQVGSISGAREKDLRFTVAYTPSQSQVGTQPIIVNQQAFEAVDRFTSTPLRVTVRQITTDLGEDSPFGEFNGTVEEN